MSESVEVVNKTELAEALVAANCAATKKAATMIIDTLFEHVSAETKNGKKVRIHGFGTFSVKQKPARIARNPLSGADVTVPAKVGR
ncbi:MAG: HU family DNA-binding protein, partial [Burkholderiales bacterium]